MRRFKGSVKKSSRGEKEGGGKGAQETDREEDVIEGTNREHTSPIGGWGYLFQGCDVLGVLFWRCHEYGIPFSFFKVSTVRLCRVCCSI